MDSGIVSNKEEEYIAKFLIDDGYGDLDVIPVICVLSGSRAYGLNNEDSDRDYIAIHIMGSWNCLEHPRYRPNLQVIRRNFSQDLTLIPPGNTESTVSLDSYELWKIVDMLVKGSFSVYELMYLPTIHQDPSSNHLLHLIRDSLTTRIGHMAISNCKSTQRKHRSKRKGAILSYYRLLQAIYFLRENEFQWDAKSLWEYAGSTIPAGQATLHIYQDPQQRQEQLTEGEIYFIEKEYEHLIRETTNAMMASRLPAECPKAQLQEILTAIKRTRGNLL